MCVLMCCAVQRYFIQTVIKHLTKYWKKQKFSFLRVFLSPVTHVEFVTNRSDENWRNTYWNRSVYFFSPTSISICKFFNETFKMCDTEIKKTNNWTGFKESSFLVCTVTVATINKILLYNRWSIYFQVNNAFSFYLNKSTW